MPFWDVCLAAPGIEVTADSEDDAWRYAREDAQELIASWNWENNGVHFSTGPATDPQDVSIEDLDLEDHDDDVWIFTAYLTVCVEAPDETKALAKALQFLREI